MEDLLKQLTELNGPCGFEQNVTYFIENVVEDKVDHVKVDGIGNVIARKKGSKPGPVKIGRAHV